MVRIMLPLFLFLLGGQVVTVVMPYPSEVVTVGMVGSGEITVTPYSGRVIVGASKTVAVNGYATVTLSAIPGYTIDIVKVAGDIDTAIQQNNEVRMPVILR